MTSVAMRSLLGKAMLQRFNLLHSSQLLPSILQKSTLTGGKGTKHHDGVQVMKDLLRDATDAKNAAARIQYKVRNRGSAAPPSIKKAAAQLEKSARSLEYHTEKEKNARRVRFWEAAKQRPGKNDDSGFD